MNTSQGERKAWVWPLGAGRMGSQPGLDLIPVQCIRGSSMSRLQTMETEALSLCSFPDVTKLVSEAGAAPRPDRPLRRPLLLVTPMCEPEPLACRDPGQGGQPCARWHWRLESLDTSPRASLVTAVSRWEGPHAHTLDTARPRSVHSSSLCGHPSATPWDLGCSRGCRFLLGGWASGLWSAPGRWRRVWGSGFRQCTGRGLGLGRCLPYRKTHDMPAMPWPRCLLG